MGTKKYSRTNCDYSFKGLEETVELVLDGVNLDSIWSFFRKMEDYLRVYREGITVQPLMNAALKKYKSQCKNCEDNN